MGSIDFVNIKKSFDNNTIIDELNLRIKDGSFTVLVGPSGCGKTTLLRMISGIGPQTSGQVLIDGVDVSNIDPGKRQVSMVFQNYAIYPTMTVRENIEFGLKNNRIPKEERDKIINEVAEKTDLTAYLKRKPSTLSGGQRQRIALARAMSKNPLIFLMDEPLSNLDAKLRVQMRTELIRLHKRLKKTFVYVTHDQVEAMSMADEIILMDNGIIKQQASPEEMYNNPQNLFTACFIGSPSMNLIDVDNSGIKMGFRPEKTYFSDAKDVNSIFSVEAQIKTKEMLGRETVYLLSDKYNREMMAIRIDNRYEVEDKIVINLYSTDLFFFNKESDRIYNHTQEYKDCLQKVRSLNDAN